MCVLTSFYFRIILKMITYLNINLIGILHCSKLIRISFFI